MKRRRLCQQHSFLLSKEFKYKINHRICTAIVSCIPDENTHAPSKKKKEKKRQVHQHLTDALIVNSFT